MKKIVVLAALFLGQAALADSTVFNCVVPSATNAVTLTVVKGDDASIDFVTITINNAGKQVAQMYSQGDKDSVAAQTQSGYLNLLVLSDTTGQVDGVITDSGFLALNKDASGDFTGFLAAQGNIYPLTCKP